MKQPKYKALRALVFDRARRYQAGPGSGSRSAQNFPLSKRFLPLSWSPEDGRAPTFMGWDPASAQGDLSVMGVVENGKFWVVDPSNKDSDGSVTVSDGCGFFEL